MDVVHLNGAYLPRDEARVSVDDRGFLFGDGVYEFTPAYHGRFFRASRHRERLARSLHAVEITFELEAWDRIHESLLQHNGLTEHPSVGVYLQVTRGRAPRAHLFPPAGTSPTVFAFARAFERPERSVWERGYSAVTRPDTRWGRVDLKTLQLLPNVLALEAARKAGAPEAIFVRDGVALEGAHNNLFVVIGGVVRTHPLSNQILGGVSREVVLELARERGYDVAEAPTSVDELASATEVFMTGSSTELRPIVEVDGRRVGSGTAGPVARELYEAFLDRIREECGKGPDPP